MDPIRLSRQVSPALNPLQRAGLGALANQQRVTDYPYYSSVCFRAGGIPHLDDQDNPIGTTYSFPVQIRRAFAYGRGHDGAIAGFNTLIDGLMTLAETNLVAAHQTISGQQVQIDGIAIFVKPASTCG